MKNNLLKTVIIMVLLNFIPLLNFAQFNQTGWFWNRYGRTNQTTWWNIKSIGIGNFTSFPHAALHINANLLDAPTNPITMFTPGQVFRTDGPANRDNMWQMFTGSNYNNATEKARFYTPADNSDFYITSFENTSYTNGVGGALLFNSHVPQGTSTPEGNRMIISKSLTGQSTRVGISVNPNNPITNKIVSALQIGYNLNSTIGDLNGARSWMNVGTFYYANTDNMYVGLKYYDVDRSDAIINWGDNATTALNHGPDNLLFIFTSDNQGSSLASSNDGVEIARMTFNEEVPRMGVCENNPRARLSINTQGWSSGSPVSDNQLQLRIADGSGHSNFRAYTNGDLLINPFKLMTSPDPSIPDTETPKDMGIGVLKPNHPNAKLEILRDDYQQLRLTHTYNNKFTDFYTTEDGDLLINPTNLQIGINLSPGDPTQAIDAKGNARLRTLPSALFENTNPNKIVCVNADGTLNWTDASNLGGGGAGADADWYDQNNIGNPPANNTDDIYTFGNVAIDSDNSGSAKLKIKNTDKKTGIDLYEEISFTANLTGVRSRVKSTGVNKRIIGVYGNSFGNGYSNTYKAYGVYGIAKNAKVSYGVYGEAKNYGIYGKSTGYAGYFDGDVNIDGNLNVEGNFSNPSDQMLKENIQSINNANDIIMQLNPVTFNFKTTEYSYLNLSNGEQMGLIAQEVEPILPNLVKEVTHPAQYDSLGNQISPELTYKSLYYEKFIPLLIANAQEQQNKIDSLENVLNSYQSQFEMLDSLLNIVSNMSYNTNTNQNMVENFEITYKEYIENNSTVLYQNNPNPFTEETEFSYSLAQAGNVLFEIHNEQGKLIQVLADELQTEGKHIIHWNSNNLETGVYIYSLKFNGKLLVKKAIKVKH